MERPEFTLAIEVKKLILKKFISYATFLKTVQSNHQRPVKNGFITKGVLL